MVASVTIAEYNREVRRLRDDAKERTGYTQAELARRIGTSASVLSHKDELYRLPYYLVRRLQELANEQT